MKNVLDLLSKEETKEVIYHHFKREEIIFLEESVCESIGIVIEGQIDIVSYSFSGQEIIYNSLQKGDIFGNNLVFSDSPKYRGNVVAKEKSTIAFIKKESLVSILQNNKEFLLEYLKIQSNFGKTLNGKIKLLSFGNALDRFNYFLFANNGRVEYKSITSLAKTLYLERETLSRLISKLEKEGAIYRDKHLIKTI